jgi:phytoene synthase
MAASATAAPSNERQLAMAYGVCRGIARSQAKNFYYAFLALPKPKRNALCAIYAFMRHADDISDDPGMPLQQRQLQLRQWGESLRHAAAGHPGDDPVIMAVADTQSRFKIPLELFDLLINGTAMDLQFAEYLAQNAVDVPIVPYRTYEELYRYCYHVASVVGLVCIHVFGYKDPAAELLAEQTGVAFQLTNIIRDLKEDALMGRVYVPEEDLVRFQLAPEELSATKLRNGLSPAKFKPLLEFEAQRARELYSAAEKLIPLIDDDSRPALWTLVTIYRRLLEKIAARDYNVFGDKVRLTTMEKVSVLSQGLLKVLF